MTQAPTVATFVAADTGAVRFQVYAPSARVMDALIRRGYGWSRHGIIGQHLDRTLPDHDRAMAEAAYLRTLGLTVDIPEPQERKELARRDARAAVNDYWTFFRRQPRRPATKRTPSAGTPQGNLF